MTQHEDERDERADERADEHDGRSTSPRGRAMPHLRAWRMSKLIGQADLARQSGVPIATLARAERGDSVVRFDTIRKLADALDMDPQQLLDTAPGAPAKTTKTGATKTKKPRQP